MDLNLEKENYTKENNYYEKVLEFFNNFREEDENEEDFVYTNETVDFLTCLFNNKKEERFKNENNLYRKLDSFNAKKDLQSLLEVLENPFILSTNLPSVVNGKEYEESLSRGIIKLAKSFVIVELNNAKEDDKEWLKCKLEKQKEEKDTKG